MSGSSKAGNNDLKQGRVEQIRAVQAGWGSSWQGCPQHDVAHNAEQGLPQGTPSRVLSSQEGSAGRAVLAGQSEQSHRPEGSDHGNSLRLVITQLVCVRAICQIRSNHLQHHLLQVPVGSKALQPLDLKSATQYMSARHSTAQHSYS